MSYGPGVYGSWSTVRSDRTRPTVSCLNVYVAVQRCTGMALQKSQWRERQVAMGAQAA